MTLNVAVQMDHIAGIDIAGDSTFALLLEAQRRGHRLAHYTADRLSLLGDEVSAVVEPLTVVDERGGHFSLRPGLRRPLAEFDVVLMRQDPPFDMAYVTATHILEHLPATTRVVNDPAGVRNAPEKLYAMHFADLMPPTLVTRDPAEIAAFRAEQGDIVVKPLHGNGGEAVFRIRAEDENYGSFVDLFRARFAEPFVVQRYLPDVRAGDKRIILVDGVFAGALNRVPAAGDLRANLIRGGTASAADLTDRERTICARVGPALRERGLLFAGLDVIGDYLTEINVTSPTGIRAVAKLGGADVAALIWDAIEAKPAARELS